MKKEIKKKILVPVDGSDRSLKTVRYIARLDPFVGMRVTLFHVFNSVPESYWDLEKDPRSTSTVRQVRSWEAEQKKNIQVFMQRAKQFLLKASFPENAIEIKFQNRKKGFARDIIREARNRYHAVVTRRRGMTGLRGIALGSVATKLIQKLTFLPVILVGQKTVDNRILLAFDGSPGSMRAVDFVGSTLGGFDFEICLVHVIRGNDENQSEFQHIMSPNKHSESTRKEMVSLLREAKAKLINKGFKPTGISTEIITGTHSRSKTMADKARRENYATIVMGRRGHSSVRDFFIGRVTNKVIHTTRDRTVWIVR
jgi:nucleotide-binding universal stress UspA family protein